MTDIEQHLFRHSERVCEAKNLAVRRLAASRIKKTQTLCVYEGFSGNYALDYALISAP
jgi:hypothetical protein